MAGEIVTLSGSARTASPQAAPTVYYDGACPLCAREIAAYRGSRNGEVLRWVDASRCDAAQLDGLDRAAALERLHVRREDGTVVDGAAAFAAIWQRLPSFAILGRFARLPGAIPLLDFGYRGFLRLRALWRQAPLRYPTAVVGDLRTDHAGETGAVMIYRGILATSRDEALRRFAALHLATEETHLRAIEAILPAGSRSLLTPLWRVAGWLTGALPALASSQAVYATISAVETFVDRHYADQIDRIDALLRQRRDPALANLRNLLVQCQLDEVAHRDEADAARHAPPGALLRGWARLVAAGSAIAVGISRRI